MPQLTYKDPLLAMHSQGYQGGSSLSVAMGVQMVGHGQRLCSRMGVEQWGQTKNDELTARTGLRSS